MGLVWLRAACLLMFRVMFLFCWRISMESLALELAGSWVEFGLSVGIDVHQQMHGYGSMVHIHNGILLRYKKECI